MNDADKEITDLLEKHGLKHSYEFTFPRYRILPDEVDLALKVLQNHGMRVVIVLIPKDALPQEKK